jgi:hypothetical protein
MTPFDVVIVYAIGVGAGFATGWLWGISYISKRLRR